ncbi:MAG: hypothetical protein AAFR37_25765, partial [Cyanobacteria bacterium J06628_3]
MANGTDACRICDDCMRDKEREMMKIMMIYDDDHNDDGGVDDDNNDKNNGNENNNDDLSVTMVKDFLRE